MKKLLFIVSFVLCVCLFALPAFAEGVYFYDEYLGEYLGYYAADEYGEFDDAVVFPEPANYDYFTGYYDPDNSDVEYAGIGYPLNGYYFNLSGQPDYTCYLEYDLPEQDPSYVRFYDGVNGNLLDTVEVNDGHIVDGGSFPSAPSKSGLTFAGWYDNIDGFGSSYSRVEFENGYGESLDLFALYTVQWQKILPFSSGSTSGSVFYGTPKRDVFGTPYEPEGYTFLHWSTSSNGVAYSVNGLLTESLTLYAVYRYDGGTGTDPVDPPPYNPPTTEPYEPNLDRETVLMLGDTLWQGFFEGFSGLVNNSYIFGYSVLTIIAGLFIIFLAVVLIKFLKG